MTLQRPGGSYYPAPNVYPVTPTYGGGGLSGALRQAAGAIGSALGITPSRGNAPGGGGQPVLGTWQRSASTTTDASGSGTILIPQPQFVTDDLSVDRIYVDTAYSGTLTAVLSGTTLGSYANQQTIGSFLVPAGGILQIKGTGWPASTVVTAYCSGTEAFGTTLVAPIGPPLAIGQNIQTVATLYDMGTFSLTAIKSGSHVTLTGSTAVTTIYFSITGGAPTGVAFTLTFTGATSGQVSTFSAAAGVPAGGNLNGSLTVTPGLDSQFTLTSNQSWSAGSISLAGHI